MRQQATGVVLASLLLLSFGDDILTRHRTDNRSKKTPQLTRHEPLSSKPSNQNEVNSTLQLLTNPRTNLVGLANITSDIGVVFDLNTNYVAILYGTSGWFTVINLETKVGVYTLNDTSSGWISLYKSFDAYFQSLTSVKPLYTVALKSGTKFGPGNLDRFISVDLQLTINGLSRNEFCVTRCEAFNRFVEYSTTLIATVKGPLKGILNVLGRGTIPTCLNIRSLGIRLQGLASISSKLQGGFSTLAKIRLDWNLVFNIELSCRLFIYIFSELNAHNINAGAIARDYGDNFIVVLNQLAGNSSRGMNGVIRICSEVHHLALGLSTIGSVLEVLVEYFGHPVNVARNYEEFIKELQLGLDFIKKLGATDELKIVVGLVEGLTERNYQINGINLYEVIKTCFKSSASPPLHHVVQILEYIRGTVRIEFSTGLLLYRLIALTAYGSVNVVVALVPGIRVDYTVDILSYILHGVKTNNLQDDLYNFLLSLRVFGPLLDVINDSLESFSFVTFDEIFASPYFNPYKQMIIKLLKQVTCSSKVQSHYVEIENDKHLNTHQRQHQGTEGKHLTVNNKEFKTNHLARDARHKEEYHSHGTETKRLNRILTHETKHQESKLATWKTS